MSLCYPCEQGRLVRACSQQECRLSAVGVGVRSAVCSSLYFDILSRAVLVCVLRCCCSCCHYSGANPVQAEEAVRDMCAAAGMAPDGLTTKLLTLIDISWQQLQCCGGGGA